MKFKTPQIEAIITKKQSEITTTIEKLKRTLDFFTQEEQVIKEIQASGAFQFCRYPLSR
jgi:hypothetical protein